MKVNGNENPGCGIAFGVGWTLFSLIFVVVGLQQMTRGLSEMTWEEVPCEMIEFRVQARASQEPPFQPKVRYRYQWEGQSYQSEKTWRDKKGEDDFLPLAELEERQRSGQPWTCRVNPSEPNEAVLIPEKGKALFGAFFATFAGVFVAIGIFVIVSSLRAKAATQKSISSQSVEKNSSPIGRAVAYVVAAALLIGGCVLFWFMGVKNWLTLRDTQDWVEAPATVIWSRVQSHAGDDGTTYSVDIFYRYQYQGQRYRSNRMRLASGGSSSGYDGKKEIVDRYPKGHQFTCYLNPKRPWEAVVERRMSVLITILAIGLPLVLCSIGGLWLRWLLAGARAPRGGAGVRITGNPVQRASSSEELVFRVGRSRLLWLGGSLLIALFWNGIITFLLVDVIRGWSKGDLDWFLTLFSIPFILVGLGLMVHFFYRILILFNPRPEVRLAADDLVLGHEVTLAWKLAGASSRVSKWSLHLVSSESATFTRGTETVTESKVIYEGVIVETEDPREIAQGRATFRIPPDLIPSWKSKHNEISWKIVQRGEIARWPDIREDHAITVQGEDL